MEKISEALFKIYDFIEAAWEFLTSTIESFYRIIVNLPSALSAIMSFMGLIPGVAYAFILSLISASIIYIIAGRNG
jgi:hypothetical protein